MNKQEIYNIVAAHLLKQGRKAQRQRTCDESMMCVYRADNGDRCAFGILLPDNLYTPKMEGVSAASLCEEYPAIRQHLFGIEYTPGQDGNFVNALQHVHDGFHVKDWPEQLEHLARQWGLEPYHASV